MMEGPTIFSSGGPQRRQSLLVLGFGLVLLATGVIMAVHFWPAQRLGAGLGLLAGLASGGLACGLALRGLWPRQLVIDTIEGALHTAGRPIVRWEWAAVRLDWKRLSSSRFATEEPVLVLADGAEIALDAFGLEAYQAVRERLLLTELGVATI